MTFFNSYVNEIETDADNIASSVKTYFQLTLIPNIMKRILLLCILAIISANNLFSQNLFNNAATDVYVMETFTNPGQFGTIPLAGPYYPLETVITNNAFTMLGGDFNSGGTLYTFIFQSPDYLLGTVDLNTGAVNYAATVSGNVAGQFLSQLSYNPTNDTFYALSANPNNENGSTFYSLNITTGVLTPIGSGTGIPNGVAMEIDNNGTVYVADAVSGDLFTVNIATGVGTSVGNMLPGGLYPVRSGFSIDHSSNTMYAVLQNRDGVIWSTFYTLNTATGAVNELGFGGSRKYSLFVIAPESLNVDENDFLEVKLYPNPTNGNFTVDFGEAFSNVSIEIVNMLGQIISSETFASARIIEQEINASAGVYFVNVSTSEGASETFKILKN